jgi:tagatose 1,6-diphosphate aldolase GatY/KbaY
MKMTDPMKVNMFVNETKVDLLAVTIGNVHGKYHFPPNLDFLRLNRINQQLSLLPQERRPLLVLHGASGLPEEMITEAINKGIVKFNVNTDLRKLQRIITSPMLLLLFNLIKKRNSRYDL